MSLNRPTSPLASSHPNPHRLTVFSTSNAPVEKRIPLWEEQNREALIPLRVASYARESISSSMLNLSLGSVKLAAIKANDHVIERPERLVKTSPADTIVFCLLNKGDAFFYSSQGVNSLVGSEAILYDTDSPFMYGFKSSMEQFIFDIPREEFYRMTGLEGLSEPMFFRNQDNLMLNVSRRIFASTIQSVRKGKSIAAKKVEHTFGDVFRQLINPASENPENAYFMAATDFVRSHAHLPNIAVKDVADAVGISERHLSRIFAARELSVGKYISDTRLDIAYRLLTGEHSKGLSIGQIAQDVGFGHSSHFSRAFKAKYGMSPREARHSHAVAA